LNTAEAYGRFRNKIKEGRADLQALKKLEDYESDSLEVEVKQTIAFFKARETFHNLYKGAVVVQDFEGVGVFAFSSASAELGQFVRRRERFSGSIRGFQTCCIC
jgi:hypothetical protein